jgi:hypothetical protein
LFIGKAGLFADSPNSTQKVCGESFDGPPLAASTVRDGADIDTVPALPTSR